MSIFKSNYIKGFIVLATIIPSITNSGCGSCCTSNTSCCVVSNCGSCGDCGKCKTKNFDANVNICKALTAYSLLVKNNATIGGNLSVIGNETVAGDLTVLGTIRGVTFVGPTGAIGARGATGATGATGNAGAPGVSEFAMFYGLTAGTGNVGPNDYAATVAPGAAVPFPRLGATTGSITALTGSTFNLPTIGTYEITFRVHSTEPGQLQLDLNGTPLAYTTAPDMNPTAGGHVLVGNTFVTTVAPNSVLSVINPAGNTPALTITPADGASTHANAQTLTIKLLQ